MVLEGVVHVLQNGGAKSKLWCCAVLVNLAYRSEENTAKIGAGILLFSFAMQTRGRRRIDLRDLTSVTLNLPGCVEGILPGLLKALTTRGTDLTRADRCQQVGSAPGPCRLLISRAVDSVGVHFRRHAGR